MNYFETVIRTMDADFSGVLVVKNPVTNVDDTGSIPSLGRFCMSPEQLNPHTATTECKCCTQRKPTGSNEDLVQQKTEPWMLIPSKLTYMQLYMDSQKIYGRCKGCFQTPGKKILIQSKVEIINFINNLILIYNYILNKIILQFGAESCNLIYNSMAI